MFSPISPSFNFLALQSQQQWESKHILLSGVTALGFPYILVLYNEKSTNEASINATERNVAWNNYFPFEI